MPRITRSRVAPQTFFRVTNLKQARTLFLASDTSQPVFTYAPYDTSLLYQQLSVLDQERVRERQSLELIIHPKS